MTVYIEVVILNNLFIDLLLGITTCVARRRLLHRCRQVIAAMIGAGIATAYAVLPPVAQIIIRIVLAPILVVIMDKFTSVKDYLSSLSIFVMLTFALGGIVTGIGNIIVVDPTGYIILGFVTLGVIILELMIKMLVLKRAQTSRTIKSVTLGFKGNSCVMRALYDSGNTLTDLISGAPVVLLSMSAECKLSRLDAVNPCDYEGYITVKTVGGESVLPLVRLDGIIVDGKSLFAYGALTGKSFDSFDVILNNTMFGREYENKRDNKKNTAIFGIRSAE